MKGFIEVTLLDGKKCLLNINTVKIVAVQQCQRWCSIGFQAYSNIAYIIESTHEKGSIDVTETYEEVKAMIEKAVE